MSQPCSPWIDGDDVAACCSVETSSGAIFEEAALQASALLFELSGRLYPGECGPKTVRPSCLSCACGYQILSRGHIVGPWDYGYPLAGLCDMCLVACSPSRIKLSGYPVQEITEVKIDGDVLPDHGLHACGRGATSPTSMTGAGRFARTSPLRTPKTGRSRSPTPTAQIHRPSGRRQQRNWPARFTSRARTQRERVERARYQWGSLGSLVRASRSRSWPSRPGDTPLRPGHAVVDPQAGTPAFPSLMPSSMPTTPPASSADPSSTPPATDATRSRSGKP